MRKLLKVPARFYAQAAPVGGYSSYDIQSTTLPNKIKVISADNESQICRISIIFKAGSRNEHGHSLGAAHMLKIAAGLSTRNATQFAITRNIQQVGASLSCTANREVVAYTLLGTRRAVDDSLRFLTEVATQQVFKPWELEETIPRAKLDLPGQFSQKRLLDLLHKAAYRKGLGNSMYASKHQLQCISSETLQHYVCEFFRSGNTAVVGMGVDHGSLSKYASSLELNPGGGVTTPSPYKGGEIRSDKGGNEAMVAIAVPTSGMQAALTYDVLANALGSGPSIKFSAGSGLLSSRNVCAENAKVNSFTATYSDTGLFGVLIKCEAKSAGTLVENSVELLQGFKVTDYDVEKCKNKLKMDILTVAENGCEALKMIESQVFADASVASFDDLACNVDSLSNMDVIAACNKLATGKLSMAALGNLSHVPYLDEL